MLTSRVKFILKGAAFVGAITIFISIGVTRGILYSIATGVSIGVGFIIAIFAYELLKLQVLFPRPLDSMQNRSPVTGRKLGYYQSLFHHLYGCTKATTKCAYQITSTAGEFATPAIQAAGGNINTRSNQGRGAFGWTTIDNGMPGQFEHIHQNVRSH